MMADASPTRDAAFWRFCECLNRYDVDIRALESGRAGNR
jgi:hypothetical protein